MNINDVEIKVLPAGEGDCIIVYFREENYRILIDGGISSTFDNHLRPILQELSSLGQKINLIVVTHIDYDHIGGIIRLLEQNGKADNPSIIYVDDIWFNGLRKIPKEMSDSDSIPAAEVGILKNMAANTITNREERNGIYDISYVQGSCLTELIIKNGYSWNKKFNGKSVIKENGKEIKIGNICITVLSPTIDTLKRLYKKWFNELCSQCKRIIITDVILFDTAFEGYYLYEPDIDISLQDVSYNNEIDWESETEKADEVVDSSVTNQSNIVLLIEYKGVRLLFPGDYPIRSIADDIPDCIDVVKLPHHGSGKSIDKDFIRNKSVSYYLLSTNGKKHNHPSKTIIGNILFKSKAEAVLIKNYNIDSLKGKGILDDE